MELKPGYKQTEVGTIPVEWEVAALADVSERIMVGIASAATHAYRRHGVPLLRNQNIKAGYLDDGDILFVDGDYEKTYRNKRLRAGDLLTARTGYPGMTCVVPERYTSAQSFTTLITRPKVDVVDSSFLSVFINSSQGQRFFDQSQIGGAQKNVNAGTLRKMPVPVPTLSEQRAIATALSDVDALLGALDRLVAKKRDLKQAAMQQLLTGKIRLPGFSGGWEVVKAGEIGRFRGGSGFPTRFQGSTSGEYPFFKVSDMNNEGNETVMETANNYISEAIRKQLGAVAFPAKSIVFAKVGAAVFLERKKILAHPSCLDNNMAAYVLDADRTDCRFIHYVLLNTKLGDLVSTTALPSLSGNVLASVEFSLPPLPEQTAIAAVLSDMAAEIAALEARRTKTRNLKQAMMQELLTGKTRLVQPEAANA